MVLPENLVIKGKYFSVVPCTIENVQKLKAMLVNRLNIKNYIPENLSDAYFSGYLSVSFKLDIDRTELKKISKFKRMIRWMNKSEEYFEKLAKIRGEIPYEITFRLKPEKISGSEGIGIEVISKSTYYQKFVQGDRHIKLDKNEYRLVSLEGSEVIKEIMNAVAAKEIEQPRPLGANIDSQVSNKLRDYGYEKVAKQLDEGRVKLETGESSADNLKKIIELFLYLFVEKHGINPAGIDAPEKNIDILVSKGLLNTKAGGVIKSSLYNGVYHKINEITHNANDGDYFDMTLYYNLTESIIEYMLDKISKYRIKSNISQGAVS